MKRSATGILILVVTLALTSAVAFGQFPLPQENHYKVYHVSGPSVQLPVQLTDQFGTITFDPMTLTRFANPVEKNGEVPVDPGAHQTWWSSYVPQPTRVVIATDQFGLAEQWVIGPAVYLLSPALKNVGPNDPPPSRNHYLCYEAVGPVPNVQVNLVDQWGSGTATVLQGCYFCNPVEKIVDGVIYPIEDGFAHLTCYIIDPPTMGMPFTATDQFGFWTLDALDSDILCNPAIKEQWVGTQKSTWSKIKQLYR